MDSLWLTVKEAADLAGYHPDTIRKLVQSGEIEARKWGRDWQVSRKGLRQYLNKVVKLGSKRGPKPLLGKV